MKNETLEIIQNRTSLRVFSEQAISAEEENKIIESAMCAPTAGNQMLYSMIIIRDQKRKEQLAEYCDHQPFIAKAPLVIVFVADLYRWFQYYQNRGVKQYCQRKELEFEAPQESDLLLAIEDAMAAAQTSVIAAESMGIGSCYIGDILENGEQVQDLLQLPQYTLPISMLVYGHYPKQHKKIIRKRFDRSFIVYEDQYQTLTDQDFAVMFQDQEASYQKKQATDADNFAQMFYERKTGAKFSKEMARSVRMWIKQWDGKKLF